MDTFNNHFTPSTAQAALEVLEAAGCTVVIPRQSLCCGRPLYDHGFLGLAKRLLREVMTTLANEIEAGTPIVGLEPSCVAVFRDELVNLFHGEPLAHQLSAQVFTLGEYLQRFAPEWTPPRLGGRAILHSHCHQKSVLTTGGDSALLKAAGMEVETPDTGCCGMAGAFGFDKHNYEVSVAIGERVLLPAARGAAADTLIVTDGFSCREQVEQLAGREALHLAKVLQRAVRGAGGGAK